MAWQRILCPIDIHDPSAEALRSASELCRNASADLYVLHSIEDFIAPGMAQQLTFLHGKPRFEYQAIRKKIKQLLQQHTHPSLTAHILVDRGDAAGQILKEAERRSIDLIVLARRKRGIIEEMLFHSVADVTLRNAPCPVLLLQREEHEANNNPNQPVHYKHHTANR